MYTKIFNGKLRLKNEEYEFVIKKDNISKFLEKIYFSENSKITITIENEARRVLQNHDELMFAKNDAGKWVWHIGDYNLDQILFNQLDKNIMIAIDTYIDLDNLDCECNEKCKNCNCNQVESEVVS